MNINKAIAIIGGGAAGFFSAICAAQLAERMGLSVNIRIFESTGKYLKKVKISGGGRCNVTHNCFDVKTFCQNYPRGSRELLSPMQRFQAKDTVAWFKKQNVNIVAESDGRMFPDTNDSQSIIDCFHELVERYQIILIPHTPIISIEKSPSNKLKLMFSDKEPFIADEVLIATGSSSAGYGLAELLGHTISERAPSLFSFIIDDPLIKDLQGLSFLNASLKLVLPDKNAFKQKGPVLITHWGLSGPAILKLSALAAREMKRAGYKGILTINWMGTDKSSEIEKILNQFKIENAKNHLKNMYPEELPKRFWLKLLNKLLIDQDKQWASISKKEFNNIAQSLVASQLNIRGQNRYKDEFVECGGVALPEIDFKTMESKICPRLHFAGEILDIDGITGGFNFQNAWTTGWVAAQNMVTKNR